MAYKIQVNLYNKNEYHNSNSTEDWHFVTMSCGTEYAFDTFENADNAIDLLKHENWDRDKYRVFPVFTSDELDNIFFDNIDFPEACPEECPYLLETKDPFSTGDSPTEYDCECVKRKECPLYTGDV
jgi:hypothetical protein